MRSKICSVIAVLALAGCAVEHGNPPPGRDTSRARSPGGASGDSSRSPLHAVFDRRMETVAPGVTRLILRVVLRATGGREAARAGMEAVAADARRQDSSIGAVRVMGYLPPAPGHGDAGSMGLVPFAYLEWVPAEGWEHLTARGARSAHHTEVVFVQDLPSHPRPRGKGRGGQ